MIGLLEKHRKQQPLLGGNAVIHLVAQNLQPVGKYEQGPKQFCFQLIGILVSLFMQLVTYIRQLVAFCQNILTFHPIILDYDGHASSTSFCNRGVHLHQHDDLVLLILFHSQARTRGQRLSILVGQVGGIGILVLISLVGSYLASRMLEGWVIGLLGFIPIVLGIKAMLGRDEEKEELVKAGRKGLLATVTLVTIASGGDNLGVYIPGSPPSIKPRWD